MKESTKRDRATSLMYGLSVVLEAEEKNRKDLYTDSYDDADEVVYF